MAKINEIQRSNPLSSYRNVAAEGGLGFAALAETAKVAYDWLAPAAEKEMEERGRELGRQIAAGQMETSTYAYDMPGGSGFRAALAQSESGGRNTALNSEGYGGTYQFGQARLNDYNRATGSNVKVADLIKDTDEARALNETVMNWHEGDIDGYIRANGLDGYIGKTVGGVPITLDGLRGMAHLGGKGGMKRFLTSGGAYNPADSNGTSLADYGTRFRSGAGSSTAMSGTRTTFRQADGKMVSRLYSPLAGPILQAHNAAASIAYQSQVLNAGIETLNSMQNEHALDPDGFQQAAKAYVDEVVKAAAGPLKGQLREKLEDVALKGHLGVVDAKHRDTRQRAINSSGALVEKYGSQLADAVAAGDPKDIAGARAQLSDLLAAREALPGLSWTPEQSENVITKAFEQGERLIAAQEKEQAAQYKSELEVILKAAKNGMHADNEDILEDPRVQAAHPELARETGAFVILRDNRPDLLKLPPKEMREVARSMRSDGVTEEWEVDLVNAMDTLADESAKAWEKDPIQRAQEVLEEKPPRIGIPEGDMSLFMRDLEERKAYGDGLAEQGYTRKPVYFSEAEAKAFGAVFSEEMPPEYRVAAAAAVTATFGSEAAAVLGQLGAKGAIIHGASLMAAGGDQNVAAAALKGEQMIEEGLVQLPTKPDRIAAYDTETGSAFLRAPGGVQAEAQVMEFAKAIYAANARGVQPGSEQSDALMTQAIQTALGQSKNAQGEVTGGVQEVMGQKTLLPIGVNGAQVEQAMQTALGYAGDPLNPALRAIAPLTSTAMGYAGKTYGDPRVDIWRHASAAPDYAGSLPMIHGQPLSGTYLDKGNVRMVPAPTEKDPNLYRMEFEVDGRIVNIEDESGMVFYFDPEELVTAVQKAQDGTLVAPVKQEIATPIDYLDEHVRDVTRESIATPKNIIEIAETGGFQKAVSDYIGRGVVDGAKALDLQVEIAKSPSFQRAVRAASQRGSLGVMDVVDAALEKSVEDASKRPALKASLQESLQSGMRNPNDRIDQNMRSSVMKAASERYLRDAIKSEVRRGSIGEQEAMEFDVFVAMVMASLR